MRKKWLGIRVAAGLCAALGWYLDLLEADQGSITLRSRLLAELKELFKSFNNS